VPQGTISELFWEGLCHVCSSLTAPGIEFLIWPCLALHLSIVSAMAIYRQLRVETEIRLYLPVAINWVIWVTAKETLASVNILPKSTVPFV